MLKKLKKCLRRETEFSKRWLSRVTAAVLVVFLFVIPLVAALLWLHIRYGLSRRMCQVVFDTYTDLLKVVVSGYFVAFIGYMGKAFLAKREEEKNRLNYQKESDQDETEIDE